MKAIKSKKSHKNRAQVITELNKIDTVRVTFIIPEALRDDYKIKCMKNGESMTDNFMRHVVKFTEKKAAKK